MTPTTYVVGVCSFPNRKYKGKGILKSKEEVTVPKIASQAKRLRIYIGESDHWKRQSLYHAIVRKAKELDMAGATVFRGIMGYGANSRIHTASIVDLSSDLPILLELIDSEEYIAKLLPFLDDMLEEGMVTIDDVEVVKYGHKPPKR
nr:DUF190 domain-containing protein [Sporomusa sphaeroides]